MPCGENSFRVARKGRTHLHETNRRSACHAAKIHLWLRAQMIGIVIADESRRLALGLISDMIV